LQQNQKKAHRVTLLVEPGRLKHGGKMKKLYGAPYGARARMILLYLQTRAIRTNSREVALGRSMRDWMERMGLAIGGETAHALREQAARISTRNLNSSGKMADRTGSNAGPSCVPACVFMLKTAPKARFGRIGFSSTRRSLPRLGIIPCPTVSSIAQGMPVRSDVHPTGQSYKEVQAKLQGAKIWSPDWAAVAATMSKDVARWHSATGS
jgi:hypothetical protein